MNAVRVPAKAVIAAVDTFLPRVAGPRILIYHQVGSGRTHEMNVEVAAFRRQIEWMQTHGEIVSLEEAVKRRGEPDAHRLFSLTFDDGYADVFENAFPFLARKGIPFTLYLTSGPIEDPENYPAWPGRALTWRQVRSMMESGLAIAGAHTHTHPDLRFISESAVASELDRSNQLIADGVGVMPRHFTYPKGNWAPQAHEAVCARYLTATLGGGGSVLESSDLHLLHRVPVQRSDVARLFSSKLRSGGSLEEKIRRRLRGYRGP